MLEILSAEVAIEVFEYFDAYQLFKAFFNLNSRFNQLLKDPQLYSKFNSKYVRNINPIDTEMWYTMANRLISVTLANDKYIRVYMPVFQQSDLICLQSLRLHRVRIDKDKNAKIKTNFG